MRIDDDKKFMARALELAANGMGHTRPNPMVGAVLVKDGEIIGEGWHEFYGGPHAEVNAFADCRADPAGATLYVTLEPCCHYGKTPPCADLIASKNLERVVVAMQDPNPLVSGKGIRKLKDAGIFVTTGVMEKEAQVLNEVFMKFIKETFRPVQISSIHGWKNGMPYGKVAVDFIGRIKRRSSYAARSVRGCHGRGGNDCRR